jgi:hypothetical protein
MDKQTFIETALKTLMRDGITTKSLRAYLGASWSNGAMTALLSPESAFQSVDEGMRKAYALEIIENRAIEYLKSQDLNVQRKTLDQWAEEALQGDDKYPVGVLTPGDDWIIGRRSDN